MTTNLGQTPLKRRRRSVDPMRRYDALPEPLRQWLANAALPWSPVSAQRIWDRASRKGLSVEARLDLLTRSEAGMLARVSPGS